MRYERFSTAQFAPALPSGATEVTLTAYGHDDLPVLASKGHRWGVLILPGGGYGMHSPLEGEPVALSFLERGCQAFVLDYPLCPDRHPRPLLAAASALAWMRANGPQWGMDRLAVCGFSAGGHLAGSLANLWHTPLLSETLGQPQEMFRPDAAILSYPVTLAQPRQGNLTFDHLLGRDVPVEGDLASLSLERSVSPQNPPTFLWATQSDQMVPVEHTLTYAAALQRAGVPMELHIYPSGPHAMGLAAPESAPGRSYADPHVATWFPLCVQWLDSLRPEREHPSN